MGDEITQVIFPESPGRLGRMPKYLITAFFIWLVFALFASLIDGRYQFRLSAWSLIDGEYFFKLRNSEVISALIGCYIIGVLTIRLLYRTHQRRWNRKFYDANKSVKNGYCLQLTEKGICWMDPDKQDFWFFLPWHKIRGVENNQEMDYLDLGTLGFLWIPTNLAEYPREQVLAFIDKHQCR